MHIMNKPDVVDLMVEKTGISQNDTKKSLEAFLEVVEEALKEEKTIKLFGFGNFEVKYRKAKKGRNPRKPEDEVIIPAHKAPVFKAGKRLRDSINEE